MNNKFTENDSNTINIFQFNSPIGGIEIKDNGTAITSLRFLRSEVLNNLTQTPSAVSRKAVKQLDEYFKGERKLFDFPLSPHGTDFQKRVWKELLKIPYSEIRSYKDIAAFLGNPNAARAIGGANNKNPIPIIIPCHRIIGKNGRLIGYRDGLDIKKFLLNLEQKYKE